MAGEYDTREMRWPFLLKLRGDTFDRGKLFKRDEDLRGLLGRHAAELPPAEAMLARLRRFDPEL